MFDRSLYAQSPILEKGLAMSKITKPGEHPHKRTLMVSASGYYRNRADIQRGLKKRDMPSSPDLPVSEKAQEEAADPKVEQKPAR